MGGCSRVPVPFVVFLASASSPPCPFLWTPFGLLCPVSAVRIGLSAGTLTCLSVNCCFPGNLAPRACGCSTNAHTISSLDTRLHPATPRPLDTDPSFGRAGFAAAPSPSVLGRKANDQPWPLAIILNNASGAELDPLSSAKKSHIAARG